MSEEENWNGKEVSGSEIKGRPEATEINTEQTQPDVVLVKLFFTNEERIPKGIPKKERTRVITKEANRGFQTPGSFEKHRKDRVDTGKSTQVRDVSVKEFISELREAEFRLSSNPHYFEKKKGGYSQYIVVTEWTRTKNQILPEIPEETMTGIKILTDMFAWETCQLWKNPWDPVSKKMVWTVNLMHVLLPEQRQKVRLRPLSFNRWVFGPGKFS